MKKVTLLFMAVLGLYSCSQDEFVEDSPRVILENSIGVIYPKQMKTRNVANWENWEKVQLASGKSVNTPWNSLISVTTIPDEFRYDIKAEDGWELVAHTVNEASVDNGLNYLFFHNKLTGILKFFYYFESDNLPPNNTAIWNLHFECAQRYFSFFGEMADVGGYAPSDAYVKNITNGTSNGFTPGWNCGQIELAYDPDFTRGTLQVMPSVMTTSAIDMNGTFDASTSGTLISTTNVNSLGGQIKALGGLGGKKAEEWVKKEAKDSKFFNKVIDLVGELGGGVKSIVSSGISRLLGSFIGRPRLKI